MQTTTTSERFHLVPLSQRPRVFLAHAHAFLRVPGPVAEHTQQFDLISELPTFNASLSLTLSPELFPPILFPFDKPHRGQPLRRLWLFFYRLHRAPHEDSSPFSRRCRSIHLHLDEFGPRVTARVASTFVSDAPLRGGLVLWERDHKFDNTCDWNRFVLQRDTRLRHGYEPEFAHRGLYHNTGREEVYSSAENRHQ